MSHAELQTQATSGFWKLGAGRAMTLSPREWGTISIAEGRVWLTVGGTARERLNLWGDHVLEAGDTLRLPPGAQVVVEAWSRPGDGAVRFDWVPQPAPALTRWQREVRQPLGDLGRALGAAGTAFARLLGGLLAYGEFLVAGRGRVLSRFESNPP